jgi:Spy/CpxP family protein refolding chaperone
MKKSIVVLLALFLLAQGTAKAAREGRDPTGMGMMDYGNVHYETSLSGNAQLKLTAEQVARIRALEGKYLRDMAPLREELSGKGRELKSVWLQTEPDRRRIEALKGEIAELRERMREMMAGHRAEVLDVLTTEQRAKVAELHLQGDFRHSRSPFGPAVKNGGNR